MGHILKMKPVFKEMIWGGRRLATEYGYSIPGDHTGECWAISAHPNGDGQVDGSEYDGWFLSSLWCEHRELFGNIQSDTFPLLIKLIDANQDLSVQVHPGDEYAREHENSLGKTECWYVLDCESDTDLVLGHHAKTKAELAKLIAQDDYDTLLNRFKIHKGDFFYIPSGTVHAICQGSLIYEAQQSSDITYRVYDYHRQDASGQERPLHVQQSLDVIQVPDLGLSQIETQKQQLEHGQLETLVVSPYFTVKKLTIEKKMTLTQHHPFVLMSVIAGNGSISQQTVKKGDHLIVCSDQEQLELDGQMEIMICHLS